MCEHQNLRYQWNSLALQTARLRWCGDVIWYTIQSFQSRPFIDHFYRVARQRLCESYTESITPSHRENLVSSITAWQTSPGSAHCSLPSLATHTCVLPVNTNFSSPTRLIIKTSTSTFGPRAFCSLGPSSHRSSFPRSFVTAVSINIFRQSLKTYLFNNYSDWLYHSTPACILFS